ncbi:MAG: HYR domain-containing protein, partial [Euryarchaeota archaeon]|nr:HYR domain-containing protein [Euryarchaeota archaeon]
MKHQGNPRKGDGRSHLWLTMAVAGALVLSVIPAASAADNTPPVLSIPADITVYVGTDPGVVLSWSASAVDDQDGSVPVACSPSSGSFFPVGDHVIFCFASDSNLNTAIGSFMAFVLGGSPPLAQPPVILVPPDLRITVANGVTGTVVAYEVAAVDEVDGTMAAVCQPASGSFFVVGTTLVRCQATNSRNLTGFGSFNVTIDEAAPPGGGGSGGSGSTSDNVPPFLTIPADMTFRAAGGGAVVYFGSTAVDDKDGDVTVDCSPASGSFFPLGVTSVVCQAVDSNGNIAIGAFSITILDPPFPPPPP